MPDVTVDVEVYCARCGDGLCNQTESTTSHYRCIPQFRVEPCEKCIEVAKDEGHAEGFDEAKERYE